MPDGRAERMRELIQEITESNRRSLRETVSRAEDFAESCTTEIVNTFPDFYKWLAAVNQGVTSLRNIDIDTKAIEDENLSLVDRMDTARIAFTRRCRCALLRTVQEARALGEVPG